MKDLLTYNETKLRNGEATILMASRFGANIEELGFSQKLKRFALLNQRCTRVTNNAVHIVLSPSREDNLTPETLQQITADYMMRIGFGNQPYIVYKHDDTNNSHIHIITTPIQYNGRSINCHNIVQRQCQPARRAIEQQYGLVPAQGSQQETVLPFASLSLSNTIREIVHTYKYGDIEELNAILNSFGYGVRTGASGSRQQLHNGIQYSRVDTNGNITGTPVNASSIYTNPGMKLLRRKFEENSKRINKAEYIKRLNLKWKIDSKADPSITITKFLEKHRITIHPAKNKINGESDVFLIDHTKRTIFRFSANELSAHILSARPKGNVHLQPLPSIPTQSAITPLTTILSLLETTSTTPELSPEFAKKKKKKRRTI